MANTPPKDKTSSDTEMQRMMASPRRHGSFLNLVMVALADESFTEKPAATNPINKMISSRVCCSGENSSKAEPVTIRQIAKKANSLAPMIWKLDLLPLRPKPLADMLAAKPID